jgi:hypothetical protein
VVKDNDFGGTSRFLDHFLNLRVVNGLDFFIVKKVLNPSRRLFEFKPTSLKSRGRLKRPSILNSDVNSLVNVSNISLIFLINVPSNSLSGDNFLVVKLSLNRTFK